MLTNVLLPTGQSGTVANMILVPEKVSVIPNLIYSHLRVVAGMTHTYMISSLLVIIVLVENVDLQLPNKHPSIVTKGNFPKMSFISLEVIINQSQLSFLILLH
jgi:hypothetical protein